MTERLTYVVVLLFMYLKTCLCVNVLTAPHHAYVIDTAGQAFEGYIDSNSKAGDKVHVIKTGDKEFIEHGKKVSYLQIVIRKKLSPRNGPIFIADTDAFLVDEDGYLVVNNTETFENAGAIEIYVVMFADEEVVSNPVPFIVRTKMLATETSSTYSEPPVVFAFGLVCLIVIFALLIPLFVRAKRQWQSSKPVFKLESNPESFLNFNYAIEYKRGSQPQPITHLVADHKLYTDTHAHLFAHTLTEGEFYDNHGYHHEETFKRLHNDLSKYPPDIERHAPQHGDEIIHLEKKHTSDSDSGIFSDMVPNE